MRVVEFDGNSPDRTPGFFADMGDEVLRIDRPGGNGWLNPVVDRGRAAVTVDIRSGGGGEACPAACDGANLVVEGFRPGVMERLGLGPAVLGERNTGLLCARMTGWGQEGLRASTAGHDVNDIAVPGALAAIGHPAGRAAPPLNLVGDFGGGSTFLVGRTDGEMVEDDVSSRHGRPRTMILNEIQMAIRDALRALAQDRLQPGTASFEAAVGCLEEYGLAKIYCDQRVCQI